MKLLTPLQALDHAEYACRAAIVISVGCLLAFMVGYFVSDREVADDTL